MKKMYFGMCIAMILTVIWCIFLVFSIVEYLDVSDIDYSDTLGAYLHRGTEKVFIFMSVVGGLTSLLLVFSLSSKICKNGSIRKAAVFSSVAANVFFYVFFVLLFNGGGDGILILSVLWFIGFVLCATLIIISVFKPSMTDIECCSNDKKKDHQRKCC